MHETGPARTKNVNVCVNFGKTDFLLPANASYVGFDTWVLDDTIFHQSQHGMTIRLSLDDRSTDVYCQISRSALLSRSQQSTTFQRVLRWAIQWPLIATLETFTSVYFVHGSAIQSGTKVMLISGDSGVGKSTIASALRDYPRRRVIADNFVGVAGNQVLSIPETRRLLAGSGGYMPPTVRRTALGKHHYPLDQARQPHELVSVVFLGRSDAFVVRPIDRLRAIQQHLALRAKSTEFPECGYLFALPFILGGMAQTTLSPELDPGIPHSLMSYNTTYSRTEALEWLRDQF